MARPQRGPDFERENQALLGLADAIAQAPALAFERLCEAAMALCDAGSAGVSLLEPGGLQFVWRAVAGAWAPQVGGTMPRHDSPCGVVLDRDDAVLMTDPQAAYPAAAGIEPRIVEILLAPIRADGRAIGTVWILSHDDARRFDAEDARRLASMARFASAASQSHAADTALRRAREQLSLTLDNSQIVGTWDWHVPLDQVFADRRFADLFGVAPDLAARGAPIASFLGGIHPDDVVRVQQEIERTLQDGSLFATEYRVRSPTLGTRHLLARGRSEHDAEGRALLFRGAVVDISDQRVAERDLDRSRSRYRTLFETLETGFCVIEMVRDADGRPTDYRFVEINPAFERQTGLADAVGRTIREMVPTIEQEWLDRYDQVSRSGIAARFESHARDLGDRWYDVQAFRPDDRALDQVAILFNDVTARRRAEAELRGREDSLRSLAQALPNHVWTATPQGGLDWFNEQVYAYSGAAPGELDGDRWAAIVHPDDVASAAARWQLALAQGTPYETGFRLHRHDGAWRWHIARAVPLRAADGSVTRWIGTNTDIEDQKAAEVVLADLNAALEGRVAERTAALMAVEDALRQSQKMEAVGQLTGGVAHDFNNLLTIIRTSVDLMRRPNLADARRQRLVDAISNAVSRATKLTSQLLAFARRQVLKPEVFDVAANVLTMTEMIGTLTGVRITVDTQVMDPDCFVNADASQFDTAIVNLAVNARDAMERGGLMTITVRRCSSIPSVRAHPAVAGDFVAVSVKDTGVGIAADHLVRIFEPFYTTKGVGHGTGLGLSQVYGFAKQSEGEVQVESTLGAGSTFTLYLPRTRACSAAGEAVSDAARPLGENSGGILVVEDNPDVAASVEQSLQELGYSTVLASGAAQALAELQTDATRFAAVFSDVVMSGINGIELADEIRRRGLTVPIVLTSGYSEVLAQGPQHGFALLPKPYSLDALAQVLRDAITPALDKAPNDGERQQTLRTAVADALGGTASPELARLTELETLQVLDTEAEQAYDALTRAAASFFDAPIALISLVDADRQWFKSRVGLQATETPREHAFCAHAIREPGQVMVVGDATRDDRFASNPLVTGDPNIRFYAGAPLVTSSGHALGTLCVIDRQARQIDARQAEMLQLLAAQVVRQLELRREELLRPPKPDRSPAPPR